MRRFIHIVYAFFVAAGLSVAEDFSWTWEDDTKSAPASSDVRPANDHEERVPTKADGGDDGFAWSWNENENTDQPVQPKPAEQPQKSVESAIDEEALVKLQKENEELRRKIKIATEEKSATARKNEQLEKDMRELEQNMQLFVVKIRQLEQAKAEAPQDNMDKMMDLESQLSKADMEKSKLAVRLAELQKQVETLKVAAVKPAPAPVSGLSVKPDSDLFKRTQEENLALKNKLVEIETARIEAAKAREEAAMKARKIEEEARAKAEHEAELEKKLAGVREAEKEHRQTISVLLSKIPELEQELSRMNKKATAQEEALQYRERNLEALQREIDQREHRLIKAERMAAILEQARSEVSRVSDREKRDMHYNMGAIYAKEGQYHAAEKEYLNALRIDPTDASVHYNLGILYDDHLGDKQKAARHYRRYLKLNPHASDIDQVRSWLMKIEMSGR
ncbi:MAG: tetratricopeptide repeat protein [Lentisphaerae bacterium]|nr:tetratricopeptide repeat protein [Lentisphaerota bacterium]